MDAVTLIMQCGIPVARIELVDEVAIEAGGCTFLRVPIPQKLSMHTTAHMTCSYKVHVSH